MNGQIGIYTLAAYNYSIKYGAPALARYIAQHNYYQTRINGDVIENTKWCARQVRALNKQWNANDALLKTANRFGFNPNGGN